MWLPDVNYLAVLVSGIVIFALGGLAGATNFGSALFSGARPMLWLINSGYNLVAFIAAAMILSVWG